MSIESSSYRPPEASEKQQRLDQIRAEVDNITDALGMPIDEGIKETVVYCLALDLPTTQSCEGHTDSGRPWPWISFASTGEPAERFINQRQVFEQVAQKYGVTLEDVERGRSYEAWAEASRRASAEPETEEYQAWTNQNLVLLHKARIILEQFYRDRTVDPDFRLEAWAGAGNTFDIECHRAQSWLRRQESATEQEKQRAVQDLPRHQQEMAEFTQFLKKQYETK